MTSTRKRGFASRLGPELKRLREESGRSQGNVAEAIGVTQATLSNYELGKREPLLGIAFLLATEYDVTLDDLMARAVE